MGENAARGLIAIGGIIGNLDNPENVGSVVRQRIG
jgi:hypothetical protein